MNEGRDATHSVPSPVRAIFFGSGSFAVPILDALLSVPEVEVVAVISAPDRPAGRHGVLTPTPVTARAREAGIAVLQPVRVRRPEAIAEIAATKPELALLADYGQLIPGELLDLPPRGFLNVHPSALPRHRGAAPIPATLLAGDATAAVTLMIVAQEMDAGPIVATEPLQVCADDTTPQLEARAADVGAALVRRALPAWLAGRLVAEPQPAEGVTVTHPLRREDGRLDPDRPADDLERQVRAYQPWPGSFLETAAGRLIVWRASVGDGDEGHGRETGRLAPYGDELALTTSHGFLVLHEVQLAGKRRVSAAELRRGYPALVGSPVEREPR